MRDFMYMDEVEEAISEFTGGAGEHVILRGYDWDAICALVRSLPDEYRQKFKDLNGKCLPFYYRQYEKPDFIA